MKKLFTAFLASAALLSSGSAFAEGPQKVTGFTSLGGSWVLSVGDNYLEKQTDILYSGSTEEGGAYYTDPLNNYWPFRLANESGSRTVTLHREYIGKSEDLFVYQEPYTYKKGDPNLNFQDVSGTVSSDFYTIAFTGNVGLAWGLYNDEEGTDRVGFASILDIVSVNRPAGWGGAWKDLGNATFVDGWVLPALGYEQEENAYAVKLQQSTENEHLYRLVNPYRTGPAAWENLYMGSGYIVFDVSDPDHVIFSKTYAGFANENLGITAFYTYNRLGFWVDNNPQYTADYLIKVQPMPFTTYKDGVVALSFYLNDKGARVYDANYGTQLAPYGGNGWYRQVEVPNENPDQAGDAEPETELVPVNMTTKIYFPGVYEAAVKQVEVDANENLPVEYFNLNGVKVLNPAKGQLVIKRQGSKVTKEIVR